MHTAIKCCITGVAFCAACLPAHAWDTPTYGETSIAMGDTLAFSGQGVRFENAWIGAWQLSAALTGLGAIESNASGTNLRSYGDVSNAQAILEKSTGLLQFFAIAGYYSIPELSTSYLRAATQTQRSWGPLPIAYASIVPDDNWSLNVGNLFALGGAEGTFSYENTNIQRGLLWGQTNSVSQGAQLNYKNERWTTSLAWTDGAYSGTFNWVGASLGYKLSPTMTISGVWNGSLSGNPANSARTPLLQNNSQIANLLFGYKGEFWGFAPYLQYSVVPANPTIGIEGVSGSQGIGFLGTYRITPLVNGQPAKRNITLPFRLEYMNTWGNSGTSTNNLLFGSNSAAWSATFTPTWQQGPYFARIEGSYVSALNYTPGAAFGTTGNTRGQARGVLELGILF
jgi:hypothetical protein